MKGLLLNEFQTIQFPTKISSQNRNNLNTFMNSFLSEDEDIKAIYEKSDEDLFKFIDQIDCFKTLPVEKLLGLKRFVANCGRIIAIGDGALRLYLNEEKEGVDVELVSFFLTAFGEEMEYIRYVTTEASEIFIDHIDDNDKNGVVFTATYKL